MNPKEYYEKNQPETGGDKFVLGLFPNESRNFFENEIKPLVEKHEDLLYRSYVEHSEGINIVENVLNDIQNASIIITDVSGFKPNVMYELGIALIKNDKHILIGDVESCNNLPFYFANLKIWVYSTENADEFKADLLNRIGGMVPEELHRCTFSNKYNDDVAEINEMVKDKSYKAALILCEQLKRNEQDNFCVEELWAETLVKAYYQDKEPDKLDEARKKYDDVLKYDGLNKSIKSVMYKNIGSIFLKYAPKRTEEALKCFSQADSFYSKNAELFDSWAFAYHLMKNHDKAYEKIEIARGLDPTSKKYILKSEFFHKWMINPNFNTSLGDFLRKQKRVDSDGPSNPPAKVISKHELFKNKVTLGAVIRCEVTRVKDVGIEFKTLERVRNVRGFIHERNINNRNFVGLYQQGDIITIKYTGNDDKHRSIYGMNIKKT